MRTALMGAGRTGARNILLKRLDARDVSGWCCCSGRGWCCRTPGSCAGPRAAGARTARTVESDRRQLAVVRWRQQPVVPGPRSLLGGSAAVISAACCGAADRQQASRRRGVFQPWLLQGSDATCLSEPPLRTLAARQVILTATRAGGGRASLRQAFPHRQCCMRHGAARAARADFCSKA
jgi:hypothetical protein